MNNPEIAVLEDSLHLRFLTPPEASLSATIVSDSSGAPELQLFGNRGGLLALSHAASWLEANSFRRGVFSLAELPCWAEASVPITLLVGPGEATHTCGSLRVNGSGAVEWAASEPDLALFASVVTRLVHVPEHEYDRPVLAPGSDLSLHIRMLDASSWL